MKTVTRGIISAALFLLTSVVYAGHPAPGVQVIVKTGGAAVFTTITDGTGQFATGDLEPGQYLIEVRGPKVVPPVRYFLVLSGARPVGQTLTNAGGDLAMQAQVRRPTSIRGQVSASRIIVLPGLNPAGSATISAGATTPVSPINARQPAPIAALRQTPVTTVAGMQARSPSTVVTTPSTLPATRPTVAAPANPTRPNVAASANATRPAVAAPSNATRPVPPTGSSVRSTPLPLQQAPRVTRSPSITGSRIIGGKRYIWVPSAPGSNLGHWVPETPQPASRPVAKPTGTAGQIGSQGGR